MTCATLKGLNRRKKTQVITSKLKNMHCILYLLTTLVVCLNALLLRYQPIQLKSTFLIHSVAVWVVRLDCDELKLLTLTALTKRWWLCSICKTVQNRQLSHSLNHCCITLTRSSETTHSAFTLRLSRVHSWFCFKPCNHSSIPNKANITISSSLFIPLLLITHSNCPVSFLFFNILIVESFVFTVLHMPI